MHPTSPLWRPWRSTTVISVFTVKMYPSSSFPLLSSLGPLLLTPYPLYFFDIWKISVDAEGRDVYERVKQAGKYRYTIPLFLSLPSSISLPSPSSLPLPLPLPPPPSYLINFFSSSTFFFFFFFKGPFNVLREYPQRSSSVACS